MSPSRSELTGDGVIHTVLIWPFPTFPHIGPTLGVAQELHRRGHRVVYAVPERYAPVVEPTGARVVTYEDRLEPLVPGSSDPVDLAFGYYLSVLTSAPELERALAAEPPDAVLYDAHLWGVAAGLARTWGAAGVQSFPTFASNERFCLRREEADAAGPDSHPSVGLFHRRVAEFAADHGYGSHSWEEFLVGWERLNIGFMPREFQLSADEFDERFAFVGPCVGTGELAGAWTPPGGAGERPPIVLASLGTSPFGHDPGFYRSCVSAFADSGLHLVLTLGDGVSPDDLGPLPTNVEAHGWLRHPAVLRHADLMISQAGIGSMMESLSEGVPLLLSPRNGEQIVNARRAEELGVGWPLDEAITPQELLATVRSALADPGLRTGVEVLRAAISRAGGAERAADALVDALAPARS